MSGRARCPLTMSAFTATMPLQRVLNTNGGEESVFFQTDQTKAAVNRLATITFSVFLSGG